MMDPKEFFDEATYSHYEARRDKKKKIRDALNIVLHTAENAQCKDLHHPVNNQHEYDEDCKSESEVKKCVMMLREYIAENLA